MADLLKTVGAEILKYDAQLQAQNLEIEERLARLSNRLKEITSKLEDEAEAAFETAPPGERDAIEQFMDNYEEPKLLQMLGGSRSAAPD